jgi:hypothetical protein
MDTRTPQTERRTQDRRDRFHFSRRERVRQVGRTILRDYIEDLRPEGEFDVENAVIRRNQDPGFNGGWTLVKKLPDWSSTIYQVGVRLTDDELAEALVWAWRRFLGIEAPEPAQMAQDDASGTKPGAS